MSLIQQAINPVFIHSISKEQAWNYRIIPFLIEGNAVSFYCDAASQNGGLKDELEIILGKDITLSGLDGAEVDRLL